MAFVARGEDSYLILFQLAVILASRKWLTALILF